MCAGWKVERDGAHPIATAIGKRSKERMVNTGERERTAAQYIALHRCLVCEKA